ncbi:MULTISPECIES: hypothetical protein [Rhodococcus]|uniref:Uncharacterized protein n=1 Tax=Rhodococcus parequi TaxID=3137122 RepID=A0ABW9FLL8_9NOCA
MNATVSNGASSRRGSGRSSGAAGSAIQFRDLVPSSIVRLSSR